MILERKIQVESTYVNLLVVKSVLEWALTQEALRDTQANHDDHVREFIKELEAKNV